MDFLLQQTKNFLSTNEMTRFHLGCGVNFLKGWLNINYWSHLEQGRLYANPNDSDGCILLNHDLRLGLPTEDDSLDAVYHCHLLEHIPYKEGIVFLERIFQAMKPCGIHRIVVPDFKAFIQSYLSEDAFLLNKYKDHVLSKDADVFQTRCAILMGMVHNHEHKCMYDWETLHWCLERVGFSRISRKMYQESDLPDIEEIEKYAPIRAMESLCVECYKE
jgi:predicted SAM-dependent methyltransferase